MNPFVLPSFYVLLGNVYENRAGALRLHNRTLQHPIYFVSNEIKLPNKMETDYGGRPY